MLKKNFSMDFMKIVKVEDQNKPVLLNLLQAYEAEFSTITNKDPDGNGLYPLDTPLDGEHEAYLVYIGNQLCGFAIKGTELSCHDISEFYIIPTKRGHKLGSSFAHKVFDMYRGKWQVRQIERADKARDFWRKVIGDYTNGQYEESQIEDSYWGLVTRQVFSNI